MSIPITPGSGAASVAAEAISGLQYQQIKVVDATGGSSNALIVNADGTLNARISGSVLSAGSTFNGSVSGTVGASVIGTVPVTQSGTVITSVAGQVTVVSSISGGIFPISGSVAATITNTNVNVSGSVAAWVNSSNASVIGVAQGSVAVAIVSGSIAASFTPPANQSVSGTVQTDVRGSVAVAIIAGSIAATFTPPANQSVSGTVNIGTGGPVSVLGNLSVLGWVPIQASNTSIITVVQGSVAVAFAAAANQSVSGAINVSGSVMLGNSNGSVITVLQAPSIVGTYAEDAAHATADKGIFVLQVRNDTMSSVTSADGDYSPLAGGPVGETIVANSPITKWVQGTADFRGNAGASIVAIAAGGSSVFTYITGVQVANMGSASVLVTLASGGSILGYTIAPAGGGSNIVYRNALKTPANFGFAGSLSGQASVLLSAQGFIAKV